MKVSRTARRYAQALFELAVEKKEIDKWQDNLQHISEILSVPEMANFLQNPEIDFRNKEQAIGAILPDISPLAKNLLHLLILKNKLDIVGLIYNEFQKLINAYRGKVQAEVTTAVPVDENLQQEIKKWLSESTGKEVVVEYLVDAGIMGGLIARIGDQLIDGSVRTRLELLRKNLLKAGA